MLLLARWPQIVGNLLAKHSCPADLAEKILVVNVSNSAFMYMLRLRQPQILNKIHKLTKQDIQAIKLRIGKIG
jgi:predicted nucleic acid-binding Zn ribbon protein